MPCYVDDALIPFGRMKMSHLVADTLPELHGMAILLGLKRSWFQGPPQHSTPHYDVSISVRAQALVLGATPLSIKDLGRLILGWKRAKQEVAHAQEP